MISKRTIGLIVVFSTFITLQGCSITPHKKMGTPTVSNRSLSEGLTQTRSMSCIEQLRSLTVLSPDDYNKLIFSFKEVSELNQVYKSVEYNANPESLSMMRMTIESKTKVLCEKVKYYSIMSVDKKINKVSVL